MSAPKYVVVLDSTKAFLARRRDNGAYAVMAYGSAGYMEELATELNRDEGAPAAAPEEPADKPEEPRDAQLDALVIPGDVKARPELHAEVRPDSYGYLGEDRMGKDRGLAPLVPGDPFYGGRAPRIGFLPPDGTVPGR